MSAITRLRPIRTSALSIFLCSATQHHSITSFINRKLQVSLTIICKVCRVSCCKNEDKHTGRLFRLDLRGAVYRGSIRKALGRLRTDEVGYMHAVTGVVYAQLSQI